MQATLKKKKKKKTKQKDLLKNFFTITDTSSNSFKSCISGQTKSTKAHHEKGINLSKGTSINKLFLMLKFKNPQRLVWLIWSWHGHGGEIQSI